VRAVYLDVNQGIPAARNQGLRLCTGEWVARLDADDVSTPQRLERQLAFAERHPEAVLIGSDVNFIDSRSRIIGRNLRLPTAHERIDAALLWGLWPIVQSSVLLRRETLEQLHGYNESFPISSDHELFLRMAEKGHLISIPERLTRYRVHASQTTGRGGENCVPRIVAEACARRGIAVPKRPLRVRLHPPGVSYEADILVYRGLAEPLLLWSRNLAHPLAWYECSLAYMSFAGWGIVRALQSLRGGK
jgi:glycosyltransferase involved in cell wall biosynthesis